MIGGLFVVADAPRVGAKSEWECYHALYAAGEAARMKGKQLAEQFEFTTK